MNWDELYQERAAIQQYDGGLSRKEAESEAGRWVAMERLKATAAERDRAKMLKPRTAKPVAAVASEHQQNLFEMKPGFSGG